MLRSSSLITLGLVLLAIAAMSEPAHVAPPPRPAAQQIDLAARLAAGTLRKTNRDISAIENPRGVRLSAGPGNGIAWLDGTDFGEGTIELDIKGKDVQSMSFVGIAFHRRDDNNYEGVYLRPFNFRTADPARRIHAVQYIAIPNYDWPDLREKFPEEFENPVDQSIDPNGWVHLRVVVSAKTVQIYVGGIAAPALEVRKLGTNDRGAVGLWVGNLSDGDFANLRLTPAR